MGGCFCCCLGLNWLFIGCKYTKSAVQIGHEPHFSSLLPYFAGFRRPLSPPALLPASVVRLRPPSCAPPVCIRGPGVCFSAARFASLLCVPALRPLLCVPALRSGPARFPVACSALYPARPRSACRASGLPPPRPAGPAAPVPSSHGPSGPPSSARRCSRIIPRPCTRRETPSPAVWRSAVSGR